MSAGAGAPPGRASSRPRRPTPAELPIPERREKATAVALRLLGVREWSAAELRRRLRDKGYDPETILHVLERLQAQGLQDDARFAAAYADSASRSKGLAGRVIQAELRTRGVDKEQAAIAATRSPEEDAETARRIAARRAESLRRLAPDVQARRLTAFLQRRGYPYDLCVQIVREVLSAAPGE